MGLNVSELTTLPLIFLCNYLHPHLCHFQMPHQQIRLTRHFDCGKVAAPLRVSGSCKDHDAESLRCCVQTWKAQAFCLNLNVPTLQDLRYHTDVRERRAHFYNEDSSHSFRFSFRALNQLETNTQGDTLGFLKHLWKEIFRLVLVKNQDENYLKERW